MTFSSALRYSGVSGISRDSWHLCIELFQTCAELDMCKLGRTTLRNLQCLMRAYCDLFSYPFRKADILYSSGMKFVPGPHAVWPKVKPFVGVMSQHVTKIESGRGNNLSLSPVILLRLSHTFSTTHTFWLVLWNRNGLWLFTLQTSSSIFQTFGSLCPFENFSGRLMIHAMNSQILLPDVSTEDVGSSQPALSNGNDVSQTENVGNNAIPISSEAPSPGSAVPVKGRRALA